MMLTRVSLNVAAVTLMGGLILGIPNAADARLVRLEITRVESPTFQGASFGTVGQYEKLVGRAFGEIDPWDPLNAVIVDLQTAPTNARRMVEYSTDVYILRPLDRSKGNHRLFFEMTNRGNNISFGQFNDSTAGGNDPTTAAHAGNGFLMRQGYTILWSGWDITVPPGAGAFTMTVPVAKNRDGSAIIGPALEEFVIDNSTTLTGTLTYPAATLDQSQATLTVRVRYQDSPMPLSAGSWEYVNPQTIRLLPVGTAFQQGTLYEFIYPARDPSVAGLAFAAIRDLAAFLHYADKDDRSNPNPLAGDVQSVYSYCFSQPCRMMHDFVTLGFNQDEGTRRPRRVFDAVLNWAGGGSGIFMNYRFAQPGRTHRQHIGRWYPEYQFPFANQILPMGRYFFDGRLRRCLQTNTCPKIFEVNSENEYWSKAMSIFHTDRAGRDLSDPPNVRYYFMSSLPHSGGAGPSGLGICQQNRNPLVANAALRALLVDLDQWVTSGSEPPQSRLPRRADGTLVGPLQADVNFPNIPGVKYNGRPHTGDLFDYGRLFDVGILTILPPVVLGTFPTFVPKTDADGNDIAGVRLPEVAVPLATYTGWGLRAYPPGADDGCDAAGQQIDFAQTKAGRLALGDPRLSIEERYATHEQYVNAVTQVANGLRQQRFLLDEDVQRYVAQAAQNSVGR